MQGENLHAVSEYRGVPVWRDIRGAPTCPRTFQVEPLRQGGDRRHQLGWIDQFCEMNLEFGFQRLYAILESRIGGQCGRGHLSDYRIPMAPDLFDQLKPIDMWHAEISDEDARWVRIELTDSIFSRPSGAHLCACGIEQLRDQRQRVGVVVNGQDVNPSQVAKRNRG